MNKKTPAKLWYEWIITSHCSHEGDCWCPNPDSAVTVYMAITILIDGINPLRPNDAYIYVGKLTIIVSDNCLSPGRCHAIIWTNDGILLNILQGINFAEILIGNEPFSFIEMHLKMSSVKLRLNVLSHMNIKVARPRSRATASWPWPAISV